MLLAKMKVRAPRKNRRRPLLDRRQATWEVVSRPAFTGTMIEDLIKAVQKVEAQADKLTVSDDAKKAS